MVDKVIIGRVAEFANKAPLYCVKLENKIQQMLWQLHKIMCPFCVMDCRFGECVWLVNLLNSAYRRMRINQDPVSD